MLMAIFIIRGGFLSSIIGENARRRLGCAPGVTAGGGLNNRSQLRIKAWCAWHIIYQITRFREIARNIAASTYNDVLNIGVS